MRKGQVAGVLREAFPSGLALFSRDEGGELLCNYPIVHNLGRDLLRHTISLLVYCQHKNLKPPREI
jgi:hypothetical protein